MQALTYTKAVNASRLHEELLAALPALAPTTNAAGERIAVFMLSTTPTTVALDVPDGVSAPAVAAVVTAHNAATLTQAQQDAQADAANLADLRAAYQSMLDESTAIQGRMDQITAGPASPTAAQTGTALKTLAGDVKRLAIAQARVLRALRGLVRELGT